jgi:hypothetical protein
MVESLHSLDNNDLEYLIDLKSRGGGGGGGPTGQIGPTGQAGPTGPAGGGPTGQQGPTGQLGPTGQQGPTGAGPTGQIGPTGQQGPTGQPGATGSPGPAPPGTGILIDSAGAVSALAVTPGQTASPTVVSGGVPVAQGIEPLFNAQSFGAIGNGIADDTAALVTGLATAKAANATFYLPPGTYNTTAPIHADTARIRGVPGNSIIRAVGSFQNVMDFTNKCVVYGLSLSASRSANYAAIRLSDADSDYVECTFDDALIDGIRAAQAQSPATIGPVTQTGPGPAIAITQWDPLLLNVNGGHLFLKVSTGGPVETAQFVLSQDGGATYSTSPQTIATIFQIGYPGGLPGGFITQTGLQGVPQAGVFVLNTTYDFTVTGVPAIDNNARFSKCSTTNCGSVFATAALLPGYPGITFNSVLALGTVTTVAGSQDIIGAGGANFIALGLRDGDGFFVAGLTNADSTPQRLMVSAVLAPDHLVVDYLNTPNQSVAGADYVATHGAGPWEDPSTGGQNGSLYDQLHIVRCAGGGRWASLSGPQFNGLILREYALNGATFGTAFADASSTASTIIGLDWETSAPRAGALYVQALTLGVSVISPTGTSVALAPHDIQGIPVFIRQANADYSFGIVTRTQVGALQLSDGGAITLITAATQLPAPDFSLGGAGATSYNRVQISTDIDWTGGFAVPKPNAGQSPFGSIAVLMNTTAAKFINLVDSSVGGAVRLSAPYLSLGWYEQAWFTYDNFGWVLQSKGGNWQFNGGTAPGSRVMQSSTNVPTMLYQFADGAIFTPTSGCRFDIAAEKNDGLGTTAGWWLDGFAEWDGANNLRMSSKGTTGGTNGGALPVGLDIAFFSAVGGMNGINFIGDNVNTWRVRINVWPTTAPF